ncbi:IclR family transcriptional regulator [Paenibacillus xerothermodurans]|uniref:Glycerol operon regulatory protein n=1 Tax=Paenibacillus xerothermodurans TaxID=1977292 RepID=A0A2W1N4U7_PAEXE|nr:IclR family transcriptional regulator [Paenibacillus xerothermodurans]PZE19739.1 IclR family transcriptional regulator [Paenibacillus xerothermodurans]
MEDGKSTVRAVERALDILLCFTDSEDLSLTEIAARVDLHKSTVHRLLASLEGRGFVVRDPASEKYRLGFRIWELSANLTHSDDPALILLPEMEHLRDQLDETVSLYVRDGMERIRVQAVQSNQAIRRVAPIGARMPLYVGASSKILVAFADPEVQQAIRQDPSWPAGMEQSVYIRQLEEAKTLGYATSFEEREPGAAAVAVPILNRSHRLVAALAVSGPSNRLTPEKMKAHAPVLMEAARRMGTMLK